MRSVAEHQAVVAGLFNPPEAVRLPIADAVGLVTCTDIEAPIALPGFDNSAMDGFAVRAADVATATPDAPVTLPVVADIPAGRVDALSLDVGSAHRIMTGAPTPAGADAVIPVELTDADFGVAGTPATVTVTAATEPGKNVRRAGSDIDRGDLALPAGCVIGAPAVGLLSALGIAEVAAARRLRVVVLSTGSELVAPGTPLRHGQIYESNGAMLTAAVAAAGARSRHLHFVPDDVTDFLGRLDEVADDADLIITSGGVSAGAFEVVKDALTGSTAGHDVEFVKVAMQPGMPQGSGHITTDAGRRVPIITLPGNPVSALVSFEIFIRPALRAAMGMPADRPRRRVRLGADIRSPRGKRQFLRGLMDSGTDSAILDPDRRTPDVVQPIGPPASHHLRYLAAADALIDVDADIEQLPAGSWVDVLILT